MYTVGLLARKHGLSRSTLLYYDSIGLLRPSSRTRANYRRYSEDDSRRLGLICRYREVGLSLSDIGRILRGPSGGVASILERRLEALNAEIAVLREQQRIIVRLLRNRSRLGRTRALDKRGWTALLRAAGMTEEDMRRWHVEFERLAPQAHQDFLESLGIPSGEIGTIRRWSREASRT